MSEELTSKSKKKVRESITWGEVWNLTKITFQEYFSESSFRHAAALSYYAIFSLVPLIYLGLYFFGRIFGNETVHILVDNFMKNQIGIADTSSIMEAMKSYDVTKRNMFMEVFGIIILLFLSSAFVMSLHKSINEFLGIKKVKAAVHFMILRTLLSRLIAIAFIGAFGTVVIIIYLAQTVAITFSKEWISNEWIQFILSWGLAHIVSIVTNFLVFVILFKYIHDAKVRWKPAIVAASVTALLVYLGQVLIKYYLTHYFMAASAGVVGSILVVMAWIFYTGQIIFLGAKLVKVYSEMLGTPVKPKYREKRILIDL